MIPDLQIPFSKPRHIGYCLSCYRNGRSIYSIPLGASTESLAMTLNRSNIINGDPLTKLEFVAVFPDIIGAIELCWHEDLEFFIEGQNLPPVWENQ